MNIETIAVMVICVLLVGVAYAYGYRIAKRQALTQIGTTDELVQKAVDNTLIKIGRDDKIDVSAVECYIAIVSKRGATFINMDCL